MITSLHLKDYESHKNTFLEFPPGLTVFIGESDKGKSGVFRAFNWTRTNRPLGDSMIPLYWESKETRVEVTTDGWVTISRGKGKSDNYYEVNTHDLEEKHNAGTDVPAIVNEFMNMEEDIHFQSQIDRSFLMFETAGERGRVLNKIAGLDKIDSCIKNANQDIRKIRTRNHNNKYGIEKLKEELVIFSTLPKIGDLLIQAEQLERLMGNKQHILNTIERLLPRKQEIEKILLKKGLLEEISKKLVECPVLSDSIKNRIELLEEVRELKLESKYFQSKLNKRLCLRNIKAKLNLLEKQQKDLQALESNYDRVNSLMDLYDKKDNNLISIEKQVEQIKSKLPNICPECGEPIK